MKKNVINIISVVLITALAVSSLLIPAASYNGDEVGTIYSLTPKIETNYDGVENYIAERLRNGKTEINVTLFNIKSDNILTVFKSAVFSNPDIFYVDANYVEYEYDKLGIVHNIMPKYIVSADKLDSCIEKFEKTADKFLLDVDTSMSEIEKAIVIHDKIIAECEYKDNGNLAYTAYGAIVSRKAVCEGYSRAYSYLLSKVGVDSKCINNASKLHCWNYVKIDGNWYHVDVTSDDPVPDTCGYVSHKYFLVSDTRLSSYKSNLHSGYKDDITYSSDYKCSSTRYDSSYFRGIKSQFLYYNDGFYYIDNNYKSKKYSALIFRKDGTAKVIKSIKDKWYASNGSWYKNSYSKQCYHGGFIYFNSKRCIYRLKLSNNSVKKVFSMPSFWKYDFYGVKTSGRYILANKKKSPNVASSKSKVLYINADKSVLKLPYVKKTSVKIKAKKYYTFKVYKGTGKVKYKSSNKKVAKVNSKGQVKAVRKGSCVIIAAKNGYKFKLKVKVY